MRRALCFLFAATLCLAAAGPALGAAEDPLFVFKPEPPNVPIPPPAIPPDAGYFEGPCGLAVDSAGNIYVSDHYPESIADHDAVDVFGPEPIEYPYDYRTQISEIDSIDGPCGLAIDGAGTLFVNDYHRAILKYETSEFPPPFPQPFLPPFPENYGAPTTIDTAHPTGVARDPVSGRIYVDNRTHVSVHDASGAPVEEGGQPLRIGAGANADSIEDAYGLAVSAYPATAGHLYVADAADDVVEVYDPAVDLDDPVAVIDGSEVPGGRFVSLRDSALAVDRVSGDLYVADNLEPLYTEHPEAAIYVFGPGGGYLGRLKHNVVDALPPGLAVDNSPEPTQGRVYVTSGDTEFASVIAYGPGAETDIVQSPPDVLGPPADPGAATLAVSGGGAPAGAAGGGGPARPAAGAAPRVEVSGELAPRALPRRGLAPVRMRVDGRILAGGDGEIPELRAMRIEFNRHGRLQLAGLPSCAYGRIQPASTSRALAACRSALVGRGSFSAEVSVGGQEPYPTDGTLLLFKGKSAGRQVLFGQIYAPRPFATSFVIVFELQSLRRGAYGTALQARLPAAMSAWGKLTSIELRLGRRYRDRGERRSFLSAGCPLPDGVAEASFRLARTTFSFTEGRQVSTSLLDDCRAKG